MQPVFMNMFDYKEENDVPFMFNSCGTQINKILHDTTLAEKLGGFLFFCDPKNKYYLFNDSFTSTRHHHILIHGIMHISERTFYVLDSSL